jgi:cohesin loading factor subunit SCC2
MVLLFNSPGREYGNKENLKEMGDVSSGMASTVIQIYLKAILESFINPEVVARHAAIKVISLILSQGLVHPVQIVPYLICVATDDEPKLSHTADRELQVSLHGYLPGY